MVCLLQLLVREPYGVVQSFSKGLQPTLQELGYGVSEGPHRHPNPALQHHTIFFSPDTQLWDIVG